MKLSGFSLEGDGASEPPIFHVAVEAKAHMIDAETLSGMSEQDIEELGFAWPDKVSTRLLDHNYKNITTWGHLWQAGLNGGQGAFGYTGSRRGFRELRDGDVENDPALSAMGVTTPDFNIETVGITQGGLKRVAEFRAIRQVLHNGSVDIEAMRALGDIADTSDSVERLTTDVDTMVASAPYFTRLINTALASPEFRNSLAWQQYWEQKTSLIQ